MNTPQWHELAEHAELPFHHGRMLPVWMYRDAAVLDAEHDAIFAGEWLCLGRTVEVANRGDYLVGELPSRHGGREVIVVRGDDGELAAFDNVCIHRGSALLHGCGNEQRITCPYHAWTFRLDGRLIGGPYMGRTPGFDPTQHSLGRLRLEVWEGFIFVSADPQVAPLAPRLTGLTEVVGRYAMAGYVPVHRQVDVWNTNWKLMFENFMDAYHVFKVHKASFGKNGDNTLDTEMHAGTDHHAHHLVTHRPQPGEADMAHPSNTTLTGNWRNTIVLGAVFPTHVMQLQPDWLWYLQISPLGTSQVRIRWEVSVAPELLASHPQPDDLVGGILDLVNLVNSEDQPVVEGILRATHAPQFARAPLSYLERNVYDFDRYVARAVSGRTR